jgi:hypothetical protein
MELQQNSNNNIREYFMLSIVFRSIFVYFPPLLLLFTFNVMYLSMLLRQVCLCAP